MYIICNMYYVLSCLSSLKWTEVVSTSPKHSNIVLSWDGVMSVEMPPIYITLLSCMAFSCAFCFNVIGVSALFVFGLLQKRKNLVTLKSSIKLENEKCSKLKFNFRLLNFWECECDNRSENRSNNRSNIHCKDGSHNSI